jgi:hypothetical protein
MILLRWDSRNALMSPPVDPLGPLTPLPPGPYYASVPRSPQERPVEFGQLLLPASAKYQKAFSIGAGADVFDQNEVTGRQILTEFGWIEAKRARFIRPPNGGQRLVCRRLVCSSKLHRSSENDPMNVRKRVTEVDLVVPYASESAIGEIHKIHVISESYEADGVHYRVRAPEAAIERIRAILR